MKKIAFGLILFLAAFAANAQTADEVVQKYLQAVGGAAKWKELKAMRQTGFIIIQGMNIPFSATSARPNMTRQEGEFQGQKFVEAFDGKVAWKSSPWETMNKPTKKDEEETKEAAKEEFEDDLIDYATKGHAVELQGTEEVEGVKCYKLYVKRKQGDEKYYFIDSENNVPLMSRSFATTGPMKGQAIETYLSDYKQVDGLMIPHTIEQKVGGQTVVTIKAEKLELNPQVDPKIFSFPEN